MAYKVQKDIKQKLKNLKRSAAELSRAIEVPYNTLNWYLNGLTPMPYQVFDKITAQFKIWEHGGTNDDSNN